MWLVFAYRELLSRYLYRAWAADSNALFEFSGGPATERAISSRCEVLKRWWTAWMTAGCDCPEVHSLIHLVFMAGNTAGRGDAELAVQETLTSEAEDLRQVEHSASLSNRFERPVQPGGASGLAW